MSLYVLKIKPSIKSVKETKLTRYGIWMDGFDPEEPAYEMFVDIFYTSEGEGFIFSSGKGKSVLVGEEFHREMLEKYSSDELLKGVRLESLLSVINPLALDKEILFEEEVRSIAHNINKEKNNIHSDEDFLELLCSEILKLKDKFKFQPK